MNSTYGTLDTLAQKQAVHSRYLLMPRPKARYSLSVFSSGICPMYFVHPSHRSAEAGASIFREGRAHFFPEDSNLHSRTVRTLNPKYFT